MECCETLVVALRGLERVQHRCDGGLRARAAEREENALAQQVSALCRQQASKRRNRARVSKAAQRVDGMVALQRVRRAGERAEDDVQRIDSSEAAQGLDAVGPDRRPTLFGQARVSAGSASDAPSWPSAS